jgi:hypothetical protein
MRASDNTPILGKPDPASELALRFNQFLAQLDTVVALIPQYKEHEFFKMDFDNVRYFFSRMTENNATRFRKKNRYLGMVALLSNFQACGQEIKTLLYPHEVDLSEKIAVMQSLTVNAAAIDTIINYFAASTVLGLTQRDIEPLLKSMEGQRIHTNDAFNKAFQNFMGTATNRCSKMVLMLDAVSKHANQALPEDKKQQFEKIKQRFDALAKIADLVVAFDAFTCHPVERSEQALRNEAIAVQLALESGAKPEEKHDILALRNFYNHFDLSHLFPLLQAIKAWETGVENSASNLQACIKQFIITHEAQFSNFIAKQNADVTTFELETIAETIHSWKKGMTDDATLIEMLNILKNRNTVFKASIAERAPELDPSFIRLRESGILRTAHSMWRPLPPPPPKKPEDKSHTFDK